jgi:hypothetical protein
MPGDASLAHYDMNFGGGARKLGAAFEHFPDQWLRMTLRDRIFPVPDGDVLMEGPIKEEPWEDQLQFPLDIALIKER